jgi:hypothetical protein
MVENVMSDPARFEDVRGTEEREAFLAMATQR